MAKSKQDYFNAGVKLAHEFIQAGKMAYSYPLQDLQGNAVNMSINGSWQAVAMRAGFDSVRMEKPTCSVFKSYRWFALTGVRKFMHFYIIDLNTGDVVKSGIKRKTHARNIAEKLGYRVV